MKTRKALTVATAVFVALFLTVAAASASQKLKGKVQAVYKDQSVCKVADELVKKAEVCEKSEDAKAVSIVVIDGRDSSIVPEKGQTIILKIKGCGKTTGSIMKSLDKGLTKDDLKEMSGKGSIVFWKNGEKGPIYVIKVKKQVAPEKDAEAKIILKTKAPKVEGC